MDASERGRLLSKLADLVERDSVYLAVSGQILGMFSYFSSFYAFSNEGSTVAFVLDSTTKCKCPKASILL